MWLGSELPDRAATYMHACMHTSSGRNPQRTNEPRIVAATLERPSGTNVREGNDRRGRTKERTSDSLYATNERTNERTNEQTKEWKAGREG